MANNLWKMCFTEAYEKAKAEGKKVFVFVDVDQLVLTKSLDPIDKLKEFISIYENHWFPGGQGGGGR